MGDPYGATYFIFNFLINSRSWRGGLAQSFCSLLSLSCKTKSICNVGIVRLKEFGELRRHSLDYGGVAGPQNPPVPT